MTFVMTNKIRMRLQQQLLEKIRYKTKNHNLNVHDMQKWSYNKKQQRFVSPDWCFWMQHVENKWGDLEIRIGEVRK